MVGAGYKIAILGAGNVASHLLRAFSRVGCSVTVWNRSDGALVALRDEPGVLCTTCMDELPADAQVYLISVKDDAVESVAQRLQQAKGSELGSGSIVAHTAGSLPVSLLEKYFPNCGVLYPMQTFSKDKELDYSKIHFFVEEKGDILRRLAGCVSEHVHDLTSEQRKVLHLASVFACNFANHCYVMAEDVLRGIGVPFAALLPLISETTDKVSALPPLKAQTGPAVREDRSVMDAHRQLLGDRADLQDIYERMSESIIKYKHDNDRLRPEKD